MNTRKTPLYLYIITTLLLFFNAIMLIFPKEILIGAKNGLMLWYNNVLPSLLPFMIFTALLIKVGFVQVLGRLMQGVCRAVFNISGEGAFAVAVGLICGCPLGAKTVCDLYGEGLLSRNEAQRLLIFCNNTGPLFVIGAVGEGMLGSGECGRRILLIQYISAIIIGIGVGVMSPKIKANRVRRVKEESFNLGLALSQSVMSAVSAITLVGGFIVLFSVICAILNSCHIIDIISEFLPIKKELASGIISGVLEVTNGAGMLTGADSVNYPLLCGVIAWGGLSIHSQSAAFISSVNLSVKKYMLGKLLHGMLAAFICFFVYKIIHM